MAQTVDTQKLSLMLKSKRDSRGLREVAKEIGGISSSTLSRIEQGNLPDIETFVIICKWLEVSPDFFLENESNETSPQKNAIAFLRADRTLPKETSEALIQMINIAYKAATKPSNEK